MCKAMEDMRNEVEERTNLKAISKIMDTFGVSIEKAMETLEIPKAQWNTYVGLLDK